MAFTDLEDLNAHQYTLMNWSMWATGLLFTCLRFFVRYHSLGRLFWDDAFQFGAMICLTILAVLNELQHDTIYSLQAAAPAEGDPAGKTYVHTITDATREQAKLQFVFIVIFWTCLWLIKGAFLMFYQRLFFNLQSYMRWWWVVVTTCVVTYIASILANFLECLPLGRRFELDLQASCPAANGIRFIAFTTGLDILTDILLMVLPIKMLVGLRITLKEKIGVAVIFSIGHVIIIFAILRVNEIYISLSSSDPNINVSMSMWSILEAAVAVVIGTLPSLRSLIKGRGHGTNSGYAAGSRGPYERSTNDGTKSSKSSKGSKEPQAKIYALQDMSGRGGPSRQYQSDEALQPKVPSDGNAQGITVTQDVVVTSRERPALRDEISIESFIHAH